MKKWIKGQLYDFACWLERYAVVLQERTYESSHVYGPLSEIVETTLKNRTSELADQMIKNNALLSRLSKANPSKGA